VSKQRRRSAAAVLAALLLGAACSPSPDHASPEPTSVPGEGNSSLKPAMAGLVVTEPLALATVPYARFGTISTTWEQIEPREGEYDFSAISAVLDRHQGIRFRLRIRTGRSAPSWLKQDTGGCITVYPATENGASGCTIRYWRQPFLREYSRLMQEVARRYEGDWQIVDVANGACSTAYAEPFILGVDARSLAALADAGLTRRKQRACIVRSTEAMMSSFTTTRVSLAGHGAWEFVKQSPSGVNYEWEDLYGASWEAERAILNLLRERFPGRLVLEDHGLGPDDEVCAVPGEASDTADDWHCYLAGLPPAETPHGWQLTLNGGSMSTAAWAGVEMGACYLEYAAFQELSEDERREVHDALIGNCPASD